MRNREKILEAKSYINTIFERTGEILLSSLIFDNRLFTKCEICCFGGLVLICQNNQNVITFQLHSFYSVHEHTGKRYKVRQVS